MYVTHKNRIMSYQGNTTSGGTKKIRQGISKLLSGTRKKNMIMREEVWGHLIYENNFIILPFTVIPTCFWKRLSCINPKNVQDARNRLTGSGFSRIHKQSHKAHI
jgi:hypothetical protein